MSEFLPPETSGMSRHLVHCQAFQKEWMANATSPRDLNWVLLGVKDTCRTGCWTVALRFTKPCNHCRNIPPGIRMSSCANSLAFLWWYFLIFVAWKMFSELMKSWNALKIKMFMLSFPHCPPLRDLLEWARKLGIPGIWLKEFYFYFMKRVSSAENVTLESDATVLTL